MAALDFPSSPTTGQVYTANGKSWAYDGTSWVAQSGSPVAASFMGCFVWNNGTQSVGNNTDTAVTFNNETFDTNAFHDTSSNTSRITIPAGGAGYYAGVFGAAFSVSTGGRRFAYWFKNGAVIGPTQQFSTGDGTYPYYFTCPLAPVYLAAGDYLECFVWQTSGTTQNIGASGAFTAGSAFASVYKVDGIVGPPGSGMQWKGPYSSITAYVLNDVVSLANHDFVASAATTGTAPPAAPWVDMAVDTVVALSDAATIVWNVAANPNAAVTITANRNMGVPSNIQGGRSYSLAVFQPPSGGPCTLTFNSTFRFPGGTAPVLSTAANAIDIFTFIAGSNGTYLYGTVQKAFA